MDLPDFTTMGDHELLDSTSDRAASLTWRTRAQDELERRWRRDDAIDRAPRVVSQRDRAAELRASGHSAATARQIASDERMMGDIVDPEADR